MEDNKPNNQEKPTSGTSEVKLTPDQEKIKQLIEIIESHTFLTDQTKYNATMYNGFKIILTKLTKIEEILNKLTLIEGVKPDGNPR
jgi:hypothetical protein